MYQQQQQSLVKDATNRSSTTPPPTAPSISLRSTSTSSHPPASALRLSSRPLSDHLSSASASPRVRFNLEPMHFEFSDVDDISEDPTTFKLRDRSPSDPLISLGETIDLRNRLNLDIFCLYHLYLLPWLSIYVFSNLWTLFSKKLKISNLVWNCHGKT